MEPGPSDDCIKRAEPLDTVWDGVLTSHQRRESRDFGHAPLEPSIEVVIANNPVRGDLAELQVGKGPQCRPVE